MFTALRRTIAIAIAAILSAAAISTTTAVSMPAGRSVTHLPVATTQPGARSDAAQISKDDHIVLHDRPLSPPWPVGAAPSHVTATAPADDGGVDWTLVGTLALVSVAVAGAAVALRPRRVAT